MQICHVCYCTGRLFDVPQYEEILKYGTVEQISSVFVPQLLRTLLLTIQEVRMTIDNWLNQLFNSFAEQHKPAWMPRCLWLSPQQKIEIIRELVCPLSKRS